MQTRCSGGRQDRSQCCREGWLQIRGSRGWRAVEWQIVQPESGNECSKGYKIGDMGSWDGDE